MGLMVYIDGSAESELREAINLPGWSWYAPNTFLTRIIRVNEHDRQGEWSCVGRRDDPARRLFPEVA
jgi:hypothetical protein